MTPLQAIVLGAVQGVTEFLPISSSGHLIIFPELLGWEESGLAFDVALHMGTLVAIIVSFQRELRHLLTGVVRGNREARTLAAKLAVGTLPALAFGALYGDFLASTRTLPVVAVMLVVWGVLLWFADHLAKQRKLSQGVGVSWTQAIAIGVAQALALVPGTSRSGSTMTIGLIAGLDHNNAARYSFLLAIPAMLAAGAKTFYDAAQAGVSLSMDTLGLGFITSLVTGLLAIRLLFYVIKKKSFLVFAVYRIALGLFLLYVVISEYGSTLGT